MREPGRSSRGAVRCAVDGRGEQTEPTYPLPFGLEQVTGTEALARPVVAKEDVITGPVVAELNGVTTVSAGFSIQVGGYEFTVLASQPPGQSASVWVTSSAD